MQAHSKLQCKTPARFLGLVGARPDERTLPLSTRLERFRDTAASGTALLTSGNCKELVHTNAAVRWSFVVFCTVFAGVFGAPLAGSHAAWGAVEIANLALAVSWGIGAVLPLACSTARSYADAFVMWAACGFISALIWWGAQGLYGTVATSAPLFLAQVVTVRYRPRPEPLKREKRVFVPIP